jgi:hypothetical protein
MCLCDDLSYGLHAETPCVAVMLLYNLNSYIPIHLEGASDYAPHFSLYYRRYCVTVSV